MSHVNVRFRKKAKFPCISFYLKLDIFSRSEVVASTEINVEYPSPPWNSRYIYFLYVCKICDSRVFDPVTICSVHLSHMQSSSKSCS